MAIGSCATFFTMAVGIMRQAKECRAHEGGWDRCPDQRMLDLIEIELVRIRKMAEQSGAGPLLYFIDLAILEVNRKARSDQAASEERLASSPNRNISQNDV
jgi:hypothetical protein